MDEKNFSRKPSHNYGIDILRIIAVFYVIILHSLGHGGIVWSVGRDSPLYSSAWALEIWAYVAVDVFALITGYISNTKQPVKHFFIRYLKLWFEVIFYSFIILIILEIYNPSLVSFIDFATSFFPVSYNHYWYFTAYTGMIVLAPFILGFIEISSKERLKKFFVLIVLFFSVFNIITRQFIMSEGYSFGWIIILFALGAIIRKSETGRNIKTPALILMLVGLYLLTIFIKLKNINYTVAYQGFNQDTFVSYVSPTILGMSIIYLILFSRIKINDKYRKIISFVAPGTFAVYLLHDNVFISKLFMINKFSYLLESTPIRMLATIIIFSLSFTVISLLIDKIRQYLFKIWRIDYLSKIIVDKLASVIK